MQNDLSEGEALPAVSPLTARPWQLAEFPCLFAYKRFVFTGMLAVIDSSRCLDTIVSWFNNQPYKLIKNKIKVTLTLNCATFFFLRRRRIQRVGKLEFYCTSSHSVSVCLFVTARRTFIWSQTINDSICVISSQSCFTNRLHQVTPTVEIMWCTDNWFYFSLWWFGKADLLRAELIFHATGMISLHNW